MGIINLTPDSFYDGGMHAQISDILNKAEEHLSGGAAILDLGPTTSRPGAPLIDSETEIRRLLPALEAILKEFPECVISVDTYNSKTARYSLDAGAHIINDISAGSIDEQMFSVIAEYNVPYIIMHMQGVPETMQDNPFYKDPVREISRYFAQKLEVLNRLGVHDVILDPGFGFGKTVEDNYRILEMLEYFKIFEQTLLVGFSRKSMINRVIKTRPDEALNGTTVLNTIALQKGAGILRVHDAREAREAILLVEKLMRI